MANFKVVFRSDNQGADTSPGWEPGCPLLVNAVQVSRNTDTGQCYLQLKLSNISGATVDSFKLQADVSYVDGASETVELNPLDADVQPAKTHRPEPVSLAGSQITNVIVRVLSVSQPEIEWHAEAGSEPGPIPVGTELVLDKKRPQNALNHWEELYKDSSKYRHAVTLDNTWWVCSCGMPNVDRDRCNAISPKIILSPSRTNSPLSRDAKNAGSVLQTKEKEIDRKRLFHHCRSCCFSHFVLHNGCHCPERLYNAAARLLSEKNYDSAYSAFLKLGTYRGSDQAAQECALQAAQSALDSEEFATLERWYSRIDRKNEIDGSIREKSQPAQLPKQARLSCGLYQIIGDEEARTKRSTSTSRTTTTAITTNLWPSSLGQLAQIITRTPKDGEIAISKDGRVSILM